jgi:hypothetical protein
MEAERQADIEAASSLSYNAISFGFPPLGSVPALPTLNMF